MLFLELPLQFMQGRGQGSHLGCCRWNQSFLKQPRMTEKDGILTVLPCSSRPRLREGVGCPRINRSPALVLQP